MPVTLNHTIVYVADQQASAAFYAEILGLPPATPYGPFLVLELSNDVSLDFLVAGSDVSPQHYAFLVSEEEFDLILRRITERGLDHWADPMHTRAGEINHRDGGRGVYWSDPDGHNLEILTRPYGSG